VSPNVTISGPNSVVLNVLPNGELHFNDSANQQNVTIGIVGITEVGSTGTAIVPTDPSAAGQHLQTSLNNAFYQVSNQYITEFSGLRAQGVNSTTQLLNGAQVQLIALVFEDGGTVNNGLETFQVTPGSLKVRSPFCCTHCSIQTAFSCLSARAFTHLILATFIACTHHYN
jgi:hypothetical protein